jgi:hypothetical protein
LFSLLSPERFFWLSWQLGNLVITPDDGFKRRRRNVVRGPVINFVKLQFYLDFNKIFILILFFVLLIFFLFV